MDNTKEYLDKNDDSQTSINDKRNRELIEMNLDLIEMNKLLINEIYERKKIEGALSDYYHLLNNVNDCIISFTNDSKFSITSWNKCSNSTYLWTSEEAVGKSYFDFLQTCIKDSGNISPKEILLNNGYFSELVVQTKKNGEVVYIDSKISPRKDKSGNICQWIAVNRDISDKIKTYTQVGKNLFLIEKSNADRDIILNSISDSVIYFDMNKKVKWSNKTAKAIFPQIDKYGGEVYCKDIFCAGMGNCSKCFIESSFKKNEHVIDEFTGLNKKTYSLNINPILDEKNLRIGSLIIGTDVTVKRETEYKEKQREAQVLRSEKMASLGVLISGIAHEINNPNNYILLNSKIIRNIWNDITPILEEKYKNDRSFKIINIGYEEVKKEIDNIIFGLIDGSDRIKKIVTSLKEFAMPDISDWNQKVDINLAVKSSITISSNFIKKSTDNFKTNLEENIPKIKGNLQLLEQAIINLIINACQALRNKKESIFLSTYYNKDNETIEIVIQDEGIGISEKDKEKIMDPFFTTKNNNGGTGLGLALSYNIIHKFGGQIVVNSKEGEGTVVVIVLPYGDNNKI